MHIKNKKLAGEISFFKKAIKKLSSYKSKIPVYVKNFEINPALKLLNLSHRTLVYLQKVGDFPKIKLKKNRQWVIIWLKNSDRKINFKIATIQDLLTLKLLSSGNDMKALALRFKIPIMQLQNTLRSVSKEAIITAPRPKIKRINKIFDVKPFNKQKYLSADTFTLQWHITNACDLHCKHCYDRTKRSLLTLKQGIEIIDQLKNFCYTKNVRGHICFTGGNPFLHKNFFELYAASAKNGFSTSILGNPVKKEKLKKLVSIQMPGYYQVSIEGFLNHNDEIRGRGHFEKTLNFLTLLKRMKISSAVMLTLTKDNINQVIPLAGKLKNYTEHFTFNRLSRTGEGKKLYLPSRQKYKIFLADYIKASRKNPVIGYKDNLLNTLLSPNVFGGCTGYGCGAAFNFVALLPDGEVHACRKFPSPVGNISDKNLTDIYNSQKAQKYRRGTDGCRECRFRPVCGGCLAVSHSYGLNVFKQKDPHCFSK